MQQQTKGHHSWDGCNMTNGIVGFNVSHDTL